VDLLLRCFARLTEDKTKYSEQVIKSLIDHHFGSEEALKKSPTGPLLDLLIFLQRPYARFNQMRNQLMPLLGERLKKLPESQVENYIRRVVNLEDTTPITDTLNVTQAKRVLDFIGQ
jgi:hypothetical protein